MKDQKVFDYQKEIETIKNYFDFDLVSLALVQSAERRFELKWTFSVGNKTTRFRRIVLQSGKGVAGIVFKTGKPMLVTDVEVQLESKTLFNYPIVVTEGLKSFGAIPLYKSNRVKGILLVGYRENGKMTAERFTEFKMMIGSEFGPFYNKEMVKS